jgi:hypothetical protein
MNNFTDWSYTLNGEPCCRAIASRGLMKVIS